MDAVINNIADLKIEIERLKQKKSEQETVIKQKFDSPRAILGTFKGLFYKAKPSDVPNSQGLAGQDIAAWLSRLLLPLTLNKTLFRRSGFIVKALVGLLSQKAAHLVNDKSVGTFWNKIKSLIPQSLAERIAPKKTRSFFNLLPPKKTEGQKRLGRADALK